MIDRSKELADIALQHPARTRVVPRYLIGKIPKAVHGSVRSLAVSTRIGIGDPCLVEKRVQLSVQSMVDQTVLYCRLVDVSRLGIGDLEGVIPTMLITPCLEPLVKI